MPNKKEKALRDIVNTEINKIQKKAEERIKLVEYSKIIFDINYKQIKEANPKYGNDDVELFLITKEKVEKLITLTNSNYFIHLNKNEDQKELETIAEWTTVVGADEPSLGYHRRLNELGRGLMIGWQEYKRTFN